MRLVRYQTPERILPGMLDRQGRLRDLSYVLIDITADNFGPVDLDILYSIEPDTLPPVDGSPAYAAPIVDPGRVFISAAEAGPLDVLGPTSPLPQPNGPLLAGVARIVGASGWSGAWMAAMADPAAGWIALGPVISAVNAVSTDLPLAADQQGDLVFEGAEIARDGAEAIFAVDGLGEQRHACRTDP